MKSNLRNYCAMLLFGILVGVMTACSSSKPGKVGKMPANNQKLAETSSTTEHEKSLEILHRFLNSKDSSLTNTTHFGSYPMTMSAHFRNSEVLSPVSTALMSLLWDPDFTNADVPLVEKFLESEVPATRHLATLCFGRVAGERELVKILPRLRDEDLETKKAALRMILSRQIKGFSKEVYALLLDPNPEIRALAAHVYMRLPE